MTRFQKVKLDGRVALVRCLHCRTPAPEGVLENVEMGKDRNFCAVWTCRVRKCRNINRSEIDEILTDFVDPIFQTHVNSYAYLVQDAEHLIALAKRYKGKFAETRFSRTALLLIVVATEALIRRPKTTVYPQTQIPRDPHRLKTEHAELALSVVREMVDELDGFLQGKLKSDDWVTRENFTLVYPQGTTFADLTW